MKSKIRVLRYCILLVVISQLSTFSQSFRTARVINGDEVLLNEQIELIKGKRIGIVTNQTGVLFNDVHIVDTLFKLNICKIKALFGPEHGIRGKESAGASVDNSTDLATGIPVYSLYGKVYKPTPAMFKEIDVIIFDIQDAGARYFTYISTLFYVMQAAAENNKTVIILDKPNPLSGQLIEGPRADKDFKSFVGIAPITIEHGMTVGELGMMFNEEEWLGIGLKCDLQVVKMKNWKREYFYDDCGMVWRKPSPNLPNLENALFYPGLCLLEGTNISEGRGTYYPFLMCGAPFINSNLLLRRLKEMELKGVEVEETEFTPQSIKEMAPQPKFLNEKCKGIKFKIINRKQFRPFEFGIQLIKALKMSHPQEFKFNAIWFDKLTGSGVTRKLLEANKPVSEIIESSNYEMESFLVKRKNYLLYD